MPTKTVADRIKRVRDRLDITDAEIARRLGVTRSAVHAWTAGKYEPTLTSLRKLAQALGCSLADLTGAR